MAAAIMMVARMAHFAAFFGGYGGRGDDRERGNNPIALLAMVILAPLAAMLIQMAISRSREFAADAGGARDRRNALWARRRAAQDRCGVASKFRSTRIRRPPTCSSSSRSPGGLMMSLFSSHPPTESAYPGAARQDRISPVSALQ